MGSKNKINFSTVRECIQIGKLFTRKYFLCTFAVMNFPEEFVEMIRGYEEISPDSFFEAMQKEPSVAIRINRRKGTPSQIGYDGLLPVRWCADGFYLQERPVFTLNPLLHAGAFYVQDASSMIHATIVEALASKLRQEGRNTLRVADLCAAPGGKTTAALSVLSENDIMIANEFDGRRSMILQENIQKWGHPGVAVYNRRVKDLADCGAQFDIVIVDAPCSGEGMMRKDSDAVNQWSRRLIDGCVALQREILDDAVRMVSPGGYLIYSTCTFNKDEDEGQMRYLKERHLLSPVDLGLSEAYGIPPGFDRDIPALRFMPYLTRGEGLFVGVMQKATADRLPEGSSECSTAGGRTHNRKNSSKKVAGDSLSQSERKKIFSFVDCAGLTQPMQTLILGNECFVLGCELNELVETLGTTRLLSAGIPAAEMKGKEYVPHPVLPLSYGMNQKEFFMVELTEEIALSYLRRNSLILPADTPKGYVVVCFKGVPLGFVKNLGSRANNLYPQNRRIRI